MANREWTGNAVAVAQVTTLTISDTWAADDTITLTMNGKDLIVTVGTDDATTDVAAAVAAAWNGTALINDESRNTTGNLIPEFNEITALASGSTVILTHDTAGVPFTVTEAVDTAGDGDASLAATTAATGPNHWDNADNWSGGAVPVNSDAVYITRPIAIKYGLDQNTVTLASLNISAAFTSTIGLPVVNGSGTSAYYEYRDTYLKIGSTVVDIGYGEGQGSSLMNINLHTPATAVTVRKTATNSSRPALLLRNDPSSASDAVFEFLRGQIGVAYYGGETAKCNAKVGYLENQGGDVSVYFGAGVTFDTTFTQTGGNATTHSNIATVDKTGGTLTHNAGTVTALNNRAGTTYYNSSGTMTGGSCGPGATISFARDMTAKVVTNAITVSAGASVLDPHAVVSALKITLSNCRLTDVTFDVGFNKTLTPS